MAQFIDICFGNLGIRPRGIMHVGANRGQEIADYRACGLRHAVLVEPLEECCDVLSEATGDVPGYVVHRALCAGRSGEEVDFHVASNAGMSSSMLVPTGHLVEHADVTFPKTTRMVTSTVDDILTEIYGDVDRAEKVLDSFVLDVQGAELEVFAGAVQFLRIVDLVWAEISHGGLYAGDAPVEEVIDTLLPFRLRIAYLALTRLRWGNALSVRSSMVGMSTDAG